MLKSFFEVGADASLFERLEITREAELCAQHIGKYPVIAVTLKDVSGESYDDALKIMSQVLKKRSPQASIPAGKHCTALGNAGEALWNRRHHSHR